MRNFFKFTVIFLLSICAKAQVPTATILGVSPVICSGATNFFAAKNTNSPTSFTWSLPPNRGASFISDVHDSSMTCTFSVPGIFTMSLTVANGTLSSTTTKTVTVTRSAIAAFNASLTSAGYPNQLSLTNYSTYSLKNYWIFSDTTLKDSSEYFIKNYPNPGSYSVSLVALGKNGCNDTLFYNFRISDSSGVTLPNIFSPNDDGVNDIFRPITRGIFKLNAWVYNRYGNLICSWDKVNGFWDGYTTSGLECRPGEYFVMIEANGFDGKAYKLKSTLTLVK